MKTAHSNPKQIARNIAVILKHNPRKVEQLKKVGDILDILEEIQRFDS